MFFLNIFCKFSNLIRSQILGHVERDVDVLFVGDDIDLGGNGFVINFLTFLLIFVYKFDLKIYFLNFFIKTHLRRQIIRDHARHHVAPAHARKHGKTGGFFWKQKNETEKWILGKLVKNNSKNYFSISKINSYFNKNKNLKISKTLVVIVVGGGGKHLAKGGEEA